MLVCGAPVGTKVPHSAVGIGSVRTWLSFEPFWGCFEVLVAHFCYSCFWVFGVMDGSKVLIHEELSVAQFRAKFVVFGFIFGQVLLRTSSPYPVAHAKLPRLLFFKTV